MKNESFKKDFHMNSYGFLPQQKMKYLSRLSYKIKYQRIKLQ